MLSKVDRRRKAAGLSIRGLAKDLEISHSLLSLVLSGRRNASKGLRAKMEAWKVSPIPGESEYSPRSVLQHFLEEKQFQLTPKTVEFYEAKLRPFIREPQDTGDNIRTRERAIPPNPIQFRLTCATGASTK
jgi:transcriptional regulator with XRE-family HTH domain